MLKTLKNVKRSFFIAKFRNAQFKNCKFTGLKFINNLEPKRDKKEGYDFKKTTIQFPMMTEDPNNAYSNICTGYTKPITTKFAAYDKELHKKYKLYFNSLDYKEADVFDNTIYNVDFNESVISSTNFDTLKLSRTQFNDVELRQSNFNKVRLLAVDFNKCYVEECNIIDSNVSFESGAKFINTVFQNVKFNDSIIQRTIFVNCTFW